MITAEKPAARTFSRPSEPPTRPSDPPEATPAPPAEPSPQPRPRGLPLATLSLIAALVLIALATVALSGGGRLSDWLGVSAGSSEEAVLLALGAKENALIQGGDYWRLITPIFLHAGIVHLAFNCLSLLALGSAVERIFGPARFLILFLFSGICGSIASYEFSPRLSVGASGAVFGLAGAIIVFTIRHRERISPRFRDEVRTVLVPLVFLQLVLGWAIPQLDGWAHLGGFLGGCLLATLVESRLAGATAMARERLPVETVFLTGVLLVAYAGFSAVGNLQRHLPPRSQASGRQGNLGIAYLQALVQRDPDRIPWRIQLGEALRQSGDWNGSAEQFREVLHRDTRQPEVRLRLAEVLGHAGRWAEVAEVLRDAVAEEPNVAELRLALADALVRAHRPEAAQVYRETLRRYPNHAGVLNNVAYFYVDTLNDHLEEARAMAQRAVKLQPEKGEFWDTLAWAYYKAGRLPEAAAAQQKAIRLSGDHPEVRLHMGAIAEAQGQRETAAAEYRAALQRDPALEAARRGLARVTGDRGP